MHDLYPADRVVAAQSVLSGAGFDAVLVTPGPDLRYLTGYQAFPLERLTCLILPAYGPATLLVPQLEEPAAVASPASAAGVAITGWSETGDPYAEAAALVRTAIGGEPARIGVANHMWAQQLLALQAAFATPGVEWTLAGRVLHELRIRKSPAEVAALTTAGAAIDHVHSQVPAFLQVGRTEREVAADIDSAIRAAGHAHVDFVIVASGPNAASPHHEVSDRELAPGDVVVVDIGGTTPDGYCSDSTRMYSMGNPPAEFAEYYDVLAAAQEAGVAAVRPGVPCEAIDAACRTLITEAGYGENFIHRTGHGIGLETHEDPYLVAGNTRLLEPGMTFSVEPGIYLSGRHGARIEDIVVCTETGSRRLNNTSRELVIV